MHHSILKIRVGGLPLVEVNTPQARLGKPHTRLRVHARVVPLGENGVVVG